MKNVLNCVEEKRDSSIELLRIISMLMIVFHHFAFHGGLNFDSTVITVPRLWCSFISMGGKIGSDIFVLIAGYFLIERKDHFSMSMWRKMLIQEGEVLFYSITLLLAFLLQKNDVSLVTVVKSLFPITFDSWWFASTYIVLFICHPLLNKLLYSLNKETFQKLILIAVVLWCVVPTFTTQSFQGNAFVWFTCLYSISAYIKLYGLNSKLKCRHYLFLFGIFMGFTYLSSLLLMVLGTKCTFFSSHTSYFFGQEKLPVLLTAISLFMVFVSLKIRHHKLINIIASCTFGVYLIHDNFLVRPFLWRKVFCNGAFQDTAWIIPYSIMVVCIVFCIGVLIDLLRKTFLERLFVAFIDRNVEKWWRTISDICRKIRKGLFGS